MVKSFGARLKALRTRAGLSQEAAAREIDVPLITYARWEQDRGKPKFEYLKQLASAFNITVDELVNGPRENIIDVTLRFEAVLDMEGEVIDMTAANGFNLVMSDTGKIGITGAAMISSREELENVKARICAEMDYGFSEQVRRGRIIKE